MNDFVVCVQIIVCRSPTRPQIIGAFLDYVVVHFTNLLTRVDEKFFLDKPCTWTPIPMYKFKCETQSFLASTIQLRACEEIIIHKPQVVTIENINYWDTVVVNIPDKHNNTQSDMEIAAMSRTT